VGTELGGTTDTKSTELQGMDADHVVDRCLGGCVPYRRSRKLAESSCYLRDDVCALDDNFVGFLALPQKLWVVFVIRNRF